MGKQECTGVDVPESRFLSTYAATPTTVPQRPTAGKVGVLDVTSATSSAATSTLSAAAAKGGGSAEGVDVAETLLPPTYATTPTPSDFLLAPTAMKSTDVDVPELLFRPVSARTPTTTAALLTDATITSVANDNLGLLTPTLVIGTLRRGGRRGERNGTKGGRKGGLGSGGPGRCIKAHARFCHFVHVTVTPTKIALTFGTTTCCHVHVLLTPALLVILSPTWLTVLMAMALPIRSHILSRRVPPDAPTGAAQRRPAPTTYDATLQHGVPMDGGLRR